MVTKPRITLLEWLERHHPDLTPSARGVILWLLLNDYKVNNLPPIVGGKGYEVFVCVCGDDDIHPQCPHDHFEFTYYVELNP